MLVMVFVGSKTLYASEGNQLYNNIASGFVSAQLLHSIAALLFSREAVKDLRSVIR